MTTQSILGVFRMGAWERSLWYRIKKLKIQVRTAEDGVPSA